MTDDETAQDMYDRAKPFLAVGMKSAAEPFVRAAAALRVKGMLVEALAEAVESVDAGSIDHADSCEQEQDNIVVAHGEGRPLAECSCWVGRARVALAEASKEPT